MHRSNRNQLSLEVRSEIWLPRGLRSGLLATVFTLLVTACGPGSSTDLNTDTTVVSASSSATASEATTTTADLSAVLEPTTTSEPNDSPTTTATPIVTTTSELATTTTQPPTSTTELVTTTQASGPLDQFGACHSYLETTTIFAADADQPNDITRAVIVYAPHSESKVSYDLSDPDSGIAHPARFTTGGWAKGGACIDVSYDTSDDDLRLEVVSGQIEVEFEYDIEGAYPSRVQMTATNLVFADGVEVDNYVTPWLKIWFSP